MSSTMVDCYGARNLVAIRATRLADDGSRICPNVDGSAFLFGGAISFTATQRVDAGATDIQRDGDGNICNTRTGNDSITGVDFALELCIFDFEMLEILVGGVLASSGGVVHGWEMPRATDASPRVEFHAWARTWQGAGQAADPYSYTHVGFFNSSWTSPSLNLQENALSLPLTGKGQENSGISIGSFDDIPPEFVGSFGGAWWVPSTDLPDQTILGKSCGYIDTPACTSS